MKIEEKILTPILEHYFNVASIENLAKGIKTKERIATIRNMQILIYSNDHNPPHFHVKSKDKKIDAKFMIENGVFLSGEIESKDLKRIKAFFNDMKTKIVMEMIWKKREE
jgi:Domain of unknown function (DUF4160)